MKILFAAWTVIATVALLLGKAEGGTPRDFSGDALQLYDSQMMSSPMMRFPAILGISIWPYINYPPAPSMTILNLQVPIPDLEQRPVPAPTPPAHSKFWIAHCGSFVELEVNPTMNLIDEEQKPCAP